MKKMMLGLVVVMMVYGAITVANAAPLVGRFEAAVLGPDAYAPAPTLFRDAQDGEYWYGLTENVFGLFRAKTRVVDFGLTYAVDGQGTNNSWGGAVNAPLSSVLQNTLAYVVPQLAVDKLSASRELVFLAHAISFEFFDNYRPIIGPDCHGSNVFGWAAQLNIAIGAAQVQ